MAKGQKGKGNASKSDEAAGDQKPYKEVYLYDRKTGAYLGPFETTNGEEPSGPFTEEQPPTHDVYQETAIFKNDDWSTVKNSVLEEAAKQRITRDRLLAGSDWTQLADSRVDLRAWADYRQALREVTEQKGFPEAIEWPTQPSTAAVVAEPAEEPAK